MLNRRRSRGFLLLEATLALVLTALATIAAVRAMVRTQTIDFATVQADVLVTAQRGLNRYIFDNYITLQNDQAVTVNGVTLADGAADGQTRRPTTANLQNMGYLPNGFLANAVLNTGAYRFSITKSPGGCVGAACAIDGLLWIDQPVYARGSTEPDGVSLGAMQMRIGGNSAASDLTNPAILQGTGGGFTLANPVAGNPAGVIGVRVGFNAEVEAAYVRVGDNRDPNLAGPLTVAGLVTANGGLAVSNNANITGTLSVTSSISALGSITTSDQIGASNVPGCRRSSLESDGRIVVRRADCGIAGQLDSSGALTLNDAANVSRVQLDGSTGTVTSRNAAGQIQVQLDATQGRLRAYDATGVTETVAINGTNGRVTSQRTQLTTSASAGGSCAAALEGDMVLDAETTGAMVVCRSGIWRRPGLQPGVSGAACTPNGSIGQTTAGLALICRSGTWTSLSDRVARSIVQARYLVTEGTAITHPACPSGSVPSVILTPVETATDQTGSPGRNRYAAYAEGGVGQWVARIRLYDATGTGFTSSFAGTSYGLRAIAQTSCDFPN